MGRESMYLNEPEKKSGCQCWMVAIICSVLIAIGLGVGLGVGLSNMNSVQEAPTTDSTPMMTPTTTMASTVVATTPEGNGPWQNFRLPTYIIPSVYDLLLHPNMTTDDYTGRNAMTLYITEATKYIVVHVDANLVITSSQIQTPNGDYVTVVNEFRVPEYEYYIVESAEPLPPMDGYVLTLEFYGSLLGKVVGLYKSVYTIPDTGELEAMVGSDMEPTDARKAYPCFDEPALKIRYRTSLVHEPRHIALSNMNALETIIREDGLLETHFNESVPMSTYLGCFAIGDFTFIEKRSKKNDIPLRVYIPPYQVSTGRANYSLEVMKIQFDFFEELFDLDYSLPKCDMISIPDFGTGAMENWGLITYRETNLLWDPMESSTYNKQRVAAVVAHELVHQWYGNIVTMKWWDNIWLNEGFASYLEYFGEQAAEPDWQIFDHLVVDDLQRVMISDDSVTSHPIVVEVSSPAEITSVFDTISYSKGATVLRYLNNYLGNDTFFGGIRHYLKKRQFSNADEQDLFADMQEYADAINLEVNIAEVMNPWVHQMGFPVVTVAGDGTVTQDHFLFDPNADRTQRPDSDFNYNWNIDVTYVTSDTDTIQRMPFNWTDNSISLDFGALAEGDWYKLNPGETGYYRVNYADDVWMTFSEQLMTDHLVLDEVDRSNLVDDALNLAPAKLLTYPQALDMTRYLSNETSYFVWTAFSRGSSYIRSMLASTPIYDDFKIYYVTRVKPIADELGWDATVGTHTEKRNRVLVLSLALAFGDQDALNNATDLFRSWINDEEFYLNPDTRELVYRYGVTTATTQEWEEMLRRYVNEPVATEQTNLLRGLTSTEDISLLDRMLDYCFNDSVVKSQEFFTCVTYVSYSQDGNRMAWTWVQLNWERIVERYGINDRNLGRLVPNIVSDYNTELQLWEVQHFFELYPDAGAGASGRATAINSIETNIAWMAENQQTIQDWLTQQPLQP